MKFRCNNCGKQLSEENRIKLPYDEGLHCPCCGNTITVDELGKNGESLFEE